MEYERPTRRVAFAGLLILSTFWGCKKDAGPARWDIDVLATLFTTRFTISDIVADSLQSVAGNGAITLVYSETLFTLDLDTVLRIPDTLFRYPYAFPLPGSDTFTLPAGFPVISENNLLRFSLQDLALSQLKVRSGTLDLMMRNKIASRVNGSFTIPGALFGDGSNSLETSVAAGTASQPSISLLTRDLAGTFLDLRGPNFNDVNTLATSVAAELDPNGSGATVTNQDSVIIEASYRSIVPSYAKGYFGNRIIPSDPQTQPFDLFNNFVSGILDVDQVQVRLKVENGIGMDLRVRLNEFQAINTRTGANVDLTASILQGPINLNRALDLGNGFSPSYYVNTLNNDNSNVDVFLENLPDQLRYDVDIELNPLGNISNGNDFLYYESKVKADLELEVPLNVITTNLVLENIVKPDLPGDQDNQTISEGSMRLFATNGFPFDANVVLDIIDRDGNLLSSVPVQGAITSGLLGANNTVQTSTTSELRADLDGTQVDQLYGEGRFRIRVVFNTANQTNHVQLLERYALDLQFTIGARYFVNGNE